MFCLSPADISHTDNPSMSVIVVSLKVIKFIIIIIIFGNNEYMWVITTIVFIVTEVLLWHVSASVFSLHVLIYYIRQHNYIYNYTLIQGVFCLLTTCFGHLCDHPQVYKSKQLHISYATRSCPWDLVESHWFLQYLEYSIILCKAALI
jgi:hypothetical protein